MALSPTHFGESIFAAMVNDQRESFLSLPALHDLADTEFARSAQRIAFCERHSVDLETAPLTVRAGLMSQFI